SAGGRCRRSACRRGSPASAHARSPPLRVQLRMPPTPTICPLPFLHLRSSPRSECRAGIVEALPLACHSQAARHACLAATTPCDKDLDRYGGGDSRVFAESLGSRERERQHKCADACRGFAQDITTTVRARALFASVRGENNAAMTSDARIVACLQARSRRSSLRSRRRSPDSQRELRRIDWPTPSASS